MKAEDIRNLNENEIRERIREEQEQLGELRFRHTIAPIENPLLLRDKRRNIARLKTILREKELAAS